MTVAVSFFPSAAALGSTVRLVGAGFTGLSTVTVGGVGAAFTVTGDTDLAVTIPARPTVDASSRAELLLDGDSVGSITVGRAGGWQTPASRSVSLGSDGFGQYTGLDTDFTDATTVLTEEGYELDIPGTVGLIRVREDGFVAVGSDGEPITAHGGMWQSSQHLARWHVAKDLLDLARTDGPFGTLPDGALGVEYDFPADLGSQIVDNPTITYTWDRVHTRAGSGEGFSFYGYTQDAEDETVEVRLLNDFTGDTQAPAQPTPGSLTLLSADTLWGTTAGSVDVHTHLTDVSYGAHYHAGSVGVAAVTAYQSSGTEPSWPDGGFGPEGYVIAGFTPRLAFTWAPPRWRPIFAAPQTLPPLRYYPRDDAVGGAPRTNRASTSRQSTARQGYTNTYR